MVGSSLESIGRVVELWHSCKLRRVFRDSCFVMATARSPNTIMAMYARKKQKVTAQSEAQVEEAKLGEVGDIETQTYSTHPTYPFPIANLPSLQLTASSTPRVIKKGDLDLLYYHPFFKDATAKTLYTHLLESLPWYKVMYLARGMTINTPRYTTVFGLDETAIWDGDRVLSAMSKQPVPSNVYQKPPRPIPGCLQELKECVEQATGESFNFVLVNFYADGTHSISPHSDDESFLGPNPCVASLSLGGNRDFIMKHKTKKDVSGEKFLLQNGDMVVMRGTTMANWLHSVPKRVGKTQSTSARVNVTFRRAINAKGSNNYSHYNVGSGPVHRFVQGSMVAMTD